MKDYQKEFLELAIESGAFKLGNFTLKSGRQSPYFFNASALIEYGELNKLADLFVKKIEDAGLNFDMVYGPAYKGIFLGSLLATKLSETSPMPICFNRKEIKDHGEGGNLIGAKPEGKILVVDDVISSGLAIRESLKLLEPFDVEIVGALVTLNRQEKGQHGDLMASSELKNDGVEVFEIISLDDLLSAEGIISSTDLQKIEEYRSHYRGTDV